MCRVSVLAWRALLLFVTALQLSVPAPLPWVFSIRILTAVVVCGVCCVSGEGVRRVPLASRLPLPYVSWRELSPRSAKAVGVADDAAVAAVPPQQLSTKRGLRRTNSAEPVSVSARFCV